MNIREIVGLTPVIPVLTITDLNQAIPLAGALARGGLRVLEITLRTPVALAAIEAVRKMLPDVVVGVGTLTRAVDFAAADLCGRAVRCYAWADTRTCGGSPGCTLPADARHHDPHGSDRRTSCGI